MSESLIKRNYLAHNAHVKSECPAENLLVYHMGEGWEPRFILVILIGTEIMIVLKIRIYRFSLTSVNSGVNQSANS